MSQSKELSDLHGEPIIIVGAGVFGLSTALELRIRGYSNVTVLDRMLPPVPDGSSVDVSRIIRTDYGDPFYAKLARESMQEWNSPTWKPFYYNSGLVISTQDSQDPYIEKCKAVLESQQQPFTTFESASDLAGHFGALKGGMTGSKGYINRACGWADAARAIRDLASRCSESGVSFVVGARGTVKRLVVEQSRVIGVETLSDTVYGSRIILATGAWTNQLINLTPNLSSSGQPVGFIQLTEEESKSLSGMPVVIDFTTGCFIFPPTPDTHLLKIARHSHGFETKVQSHDTSTMVSGPKCSNNVKSSFLPNDADSSLRDGLRHMLPQFGDRIWSRRRLCWYTDTPEGNFVIDKHPTIQGLFIATGGAGQ